jgi:LCP family protein required for cell wall assembly
MPSRRQTTPTWKKILGALFYTVFCAFVLLLGAGAQWVGRSPTLVSVLTGELLNRDPQDVFLSDSTTLLVLGCDEDRSYGGKTITRKNARSDMMLVARLDFKNRRVGGLSIPRDLEWELPGYRPQKINAYHSIGGKELAKLAVESVVGFPIDHVVVLDYGAFQEMVDIVGGVDVFVPKNMKWTDKAGDLYINLKAGRQKLDGYNAMCFVRFRHTDSDFKRMERQREFMLALKESVLKRPTALPEVVNKASDVLGNALDDDEMAAVARFLRGVPNESIKMGTLPVLEGRGYNLVLDHSKLQDALVENYLTPGAGTSRVSYR